MKPQRDFALFAFFVLAISLLISATSAAQVSSSGTPVRIAQHYLVSYTCPVADLKANVRAAGGDIDRIWTSIGIARVRGLDPNSASLIQYPGISAIALDIDAQWVSGFQAGTHVAVQANLPEGSSGGSSDAAFYSVQWNLGQIGIENAWQVSTGSKSIRVGILSTGISPDHADLRGRYDLSASVNLSPSNAADMSDYIDRNMQGTILSALISSNNRGTAGIAPDVTLVGVKIFGDDGRASVANIIDGILYAADEGRVDVINLGIDYGMYGADFEVLGEMLQKAVRHATERGVIVVASVGRCDASTPNALARSFLAGGAMVVGSTARAEDGSSRTVACYADGGDVSLYAPGGTLDCATNSYASIEDMVISALSPAIARSLGLRSPESWYVFSSGTGVSSAHVAGVAALTKTVSCDASPRYVMEQLLNNVQRFTDHIGSAGELHAMFAAKR